MVSDKCIGSMEAIIKVNGQMEFRMDRAKFISQLKASRKDFLRIIKLLKFGRKNL